MIFAWDLQVPLLEQYTLKLKLACFKLYQTRIFKQLVIQHLKIP